MNEVTIGNMPTLPYAVEEAVNRLRINISFLGSDIKKIMVISTMPDEGKSFVTMQLWRQMAESGTPSILLDADLRKSVMTDKYDITMNDGSEVWGTSYILAHDIPIQDAVLHTQISGGDILPNVKNVVNPSMLMESKQFENMLNTMADMYRYVFIDAPPLNLVSDGEKIGSLCDGAILVVRGGFTQKKMVLFLNTLFSSLIFLPFILVSAFAPSVLGGTMFDVPVVGWEVHKFIVVKSFIVLSSWIFGYFGMKHLPLTIVGPINATRPVMVLVGAMLVFGERLNLYQWIGVMLAIVSFFMLSRSGKKEGIDFKHNKWILFIVLAAVAGAVSGLYDKYLMKQLNPMLVQSWYNVYQVFIMCPIILLLWYPKRKESTPFRWDWTIICISIFLCAADFVYFYALSYEDSMISIVSMVRRGSVVVSFLFGALFFREKNLKSKAVDLILVLIGMFFLYLGSK